jgi:cold shock CspA family protein
VDGLEGTVDRIAPEGTFGFIIGPNGEEYFFHQSGLTGTEMGDLAPGVGVVFHAFEGEGDAPDEHLRAVDVHLAPDAAPAVEGEVVPGKSG